MLYRKIILAILLALNSTWLFSQCEYILNNYSHNDCFGDSVGSIDIILPNANATVIWSGPNSFSSSALSLANLHAGIYYLKNSSIWLDLLIFIKIW